MELNPLRYFVETAKERNFTRAAQNCHVAQPALSQQIRKLETLLGVKLLKRLPRGAELTTEGEIIFALRAKGSELRARNRRRRR